MNKNIVIVLGVLVVVVIGYFVFSGDKADENEAVENNSGVAIMEKDEAEVTNTMPVPGSDVKEMVVEAETNTPSEVVGSYVAYSADKLAMAETGDVVIFFYAPWCPSCRGLNSDIEQNISSIPAGVTILKIDYDTSTELKKKYGVTTQHTLVQVDKDGNLIKKWSGGSKLENLIAQIQ